MSAVSMRTDARNAECVYLHPKYARLLADHGLSHAEPLFATQAGEALRRLPTRENWRLSLIGHDGKSKTLYLKKHHSRTWLTRTRAWLGWLPPVTPARQEAQRTIELERLGIPTMTVAAFAERLRGDGTLIGAFLTEELAGFEQLDLFLTQRFACREDPELRPLILTCADVARRFHKQGFNHRDFYTCHFFIRESDRAPGEFAVHLIDLQRVQHWPKGLRRRWIVKDLAQLAYSTPRHLISRTDRLRFFKAYSQVARLNWRGRMLIRSVLRREAALRRKHGPYRPEWEIAASGLAVCSSSNSHIPEAA